ncbi:MAG: RDD family protein [Gordonia sp. (in: high G+C Gram-positive bacteria)]|uniref:RDD family protein n=1 Tax=Gordonia sp. (in: high G+C Gram-positive bacteria) TaxID=84139 RepID=UPI0039E3A13D
MTQSSRPRTAGVVSRAIAGAIDLVVAALIIVAGYWGLAFLLFLVGLRRVELDDLQWWFTTSGYVAVLAVYLFACWATSGRTIGATALGLRVVNRSGGRLHVLVALARALLCAVFPIGLAWVAVSRARCSLQDLLVRSRVVYTRDRPA